MKRKIILIGDSNVGKSCIINRFFDNSYVESSSPTICSSSITKQLQNDQGETINLNVWDTAGQERFRSITDLFYKDTQIAFVCFDYLDESSKHSIESWVDSVKNECPKCILYLVATKYDLVPEDKKDELDSYLASKMDDTFNLTFSTSAKTNKDIKELFQAAANQELPESKAEQMPAPVVNIQQTEEPDNKKDCSC